MKLFKTVHPSYLVSSSMTWLLIAFVFSSAGATGIQQLAPTANDAPVMLETGRPGFNVFAEFADSAGVIRELDNRLVISIGGSGNETIYFGLSEEYKPNGRPYSANQNTAAAYYFQVRRILPGGLIGEVVHGPFEITRANANVSNYAEAAYPVYSTTAQGPVVGSNDPTLRDIYVFTPDGPGDYSIEFTDRPDPVGNDDEEQVNIPFWDFTVVREGETEPRLGRLWSRSWALRTPQQASPPGSLPYCEWDREFNGRFYSYTEDGFVSLIDFDEAGFRGLSFTVAFNSTGPGVGDNLAEQRMSVAGENVTEDAGQHRIFLEEPDIELFPNGICGMATAGTNFTCSDEGEYCIEVEVTRPGQVEIILDFDNNNVADDSLDVILVYEFSMNDLSTCIPWDLRRGDGSDASLTDSVNIILRYAQGVQHYSAYDVEFLENGFCVNTIRPLCSEGPDPTERFLYWDDRNIPGSPGTVNTPKDGRGGSNCETDPRTWDRFDTNSTTCRNIVDSLTTGYGDKNTLNTWWFASSSSQFVARVATNTAVIAGDMTIAAMLLPPLPLPTPPLTDRLPTIGPDRA